MRTVDILKIAWSTQSAIIKCSMDKRCAKNIVNTTMDFLFFFIAFFVIVINTVAHFLQHAIKSRRGKQTKLTAKYIDEFDLLVCNVNDVISLLAHENQQHKNQRSTHAHAQSMRRMSQWLCLCFDAKEKICFGFIRTLCVVCWHSHTVAHNFTDFFILWLLFQIYYAIPFYIVGWFERLRRSLTHAETKKKPKFVSSI